MLTRDGFCLSHLIFPMFGVLIHKILTCQTCGLTRFGIFKRIGRKCVCEKPFVRSWWLYGVWLQMSRRNALWEIMHWICSTVTVFDRGLCLKIGYKMLCTWMNSFSWVLVYLCESWITFCIWVVRLNSSERNSLSSAAHHSWSHVLFAPGKMKQNTIKKLDGKAVLSNWGSQRGILYSRFCITGFVFSKINYNNHWLPK